ncbi:putative lipid II flippase FtsW [Marinimicrobium sp. ARAG 43.8]|uniref:putative lipid II flippase FtsW n=1 Tax=Marinimicrobium sp. ARAG 43.8 TaxID=3418719 RepID=UPI003CF4DCE7
MIEWLKQQWEESVGVFRGGADRTLIALWLALLSIGLVMITSASIAFASEQYGDPWFFAKRHGFYLVLGLLGALVVAAVPIKRWQQHAGWLMVATLVLMCVVLVPGIGREVNGARRWLNLGVISVQVSEVAKFAAVLFFASFFARRHQELYTGWQGFVKPILVLALVCILLLLQPDFGSAVVLAGVALAMMFIAGVKLWHFGLLLIGALAALAALAIFEPYRMQRLVTFLDPWAAQFDSGYQLTQSLIAFGRGEWFGLGLGNSLQKLFYLPEAHTDFIAAIMAEELGLTGLVAILGVFAALIVRVFRIARASLSANRLFAAFAAYGIAILLTCQVFINVGVASGLLPTKGLTLPFISYGGSSLLVGCALVAFVIRVDWEQRQAVSVVRSSSARIRPVSVRAQLREAA